MVVMVAVVTLRRTSNMALMKNLVGWQLNPRIASRPLSGIRNQMPGIKS
jgi:hypothetical protein